MKKYLAWICMIACIFGLTAHSAAESVGEIQEIGEVKSEINGNKIVVEVNMTGTGKDAVAKLIFLMTCSWS